MVGIGLVEDPDCYWQNPHLRELDQEISELRP
jgi:hypothetical protein